MATVVTFNAMVYSCASTVRSSYPYINVTVNIVGSVEKEASAEIIIAIYWGGKVSGACIVIVSIVI